MLSGQTRMLRHVCTACKLHVRLRQHLFVLQQARRGFSAAPTLHDFYVDRRNTVAPRHYPPRLSARQIQEQEAYYESQQQHAQPRGRYSGQPLQPNELLSQLTPERAQRERTQRLSNRHDKDTSYLNHTPKLKALVNEFLQGRNRPSSAQWSTLQSIAAQPGVGQLRRNWAFSRAYIGLILNACRRSRDDQARPSELLALMGVFRIEYHDIWPRVLWKLSMRMLAASSEEYRMKMLEEIMRVWNLAFAARLRRQTEGTQTAVDWSWTFLPPLPALAEMLSQRQPGDERPQFSNALATLLPEPERGHCDTKNKDLPEWYDFASAAMVTLVNIPRSTAEVWSKYTPFVEVLETILKIVPSPEMPPAMFREFERLGPGPEDTVLRDELEDVAKRMSVAAVPRSREQRHTHARQGAMQTGAKPSRGGLTTDTSHAPVDTTVTTTAKATRADALQADGRSHVGQQDASESAHQSSMTPNIVNREGRIIYAYNAAGNGELSVTEGQRFMALETDVGDGWIKVRLRGADQAADLEGYVPASYVTFDQPPADAKPQVSQQADSGTLEPAGSLITPLTSTSTDGPRTGEPPSLHEKQFTEGTSHVPQEPAHAAYETAEAAVRPTFTPVDEESHVAKPTSDLHPSAPDGASEVANLLKGSTHVSRKFADAAETTATLLPNAPEEVPGLEVNSTPSTTGDGLHRHSGTAHETQDAAHDNPTPAPPVEDRDAVTNHFINVRINRLGQALQKQDLAFAEKIKREIFDYSDDPSRLPLRDQMYEHLMMTLLSLRAPSSAIEVWNHFVRQLNRTPTAKTYTVMMRGAQSIRDLSGMEAFWAKMRAAGVQPDVTAWTTRFFGLIRGGRVDDGVKALGEFSSEWVAAARRKHAAGSGDSPKGGGRGRGRQAKPAVAEMTASQVAAMYDGDIDGVPRPNAVAMNAAISAFAARADEHIPKVLSWGRAFGLEPDETTYNALLSVSMRHNNFDEATAILQRMEEKGIATTGDTWAILLTQFFDKGDLGELSHAEQEERVISLLTSFESASGEKGIDQKGYALTVDRLLRHYGNTTAATAVLSHMSERGVQPTPHLYTILMQSYFQRRPQPDLAAVDALWQRIQSVNGGRGAPLDSVFYDRMLEGYAQNHAAAGGTQHVRALLDRMRKEGRRPSWIALENVARAMAERGEWDALLGVVDEARAWLKEDRSGLQSPDQAEMVVGGRSYGQRGFWEFIVETGLLRDEGITRPEQLMRERTGQGPMVRRMGRPGV